MVVVARLGRYPALLARWASWLEEGLVCLLLGGMIVLACGQIVARTLFGTGASWVEPVLRYLVLWAGLLGASLATRQGKHIAIDLASYLVPPGLQPLLRVLLNGFASLVAMVLSYAAVRFVINEAAFAASGPLGIASWQWNLVFPVTFAGMAIRFLAAAWREGRLLVGRGEA